MPEYFVVIKWISGIYLFFIGLFILTNKNLKRHPYPLIAIACFTESAYSIHYIMPNIIFGWMRNTKNNFLFYYLLDPSALLNHYR